MSEHVHDDCVECLRRDNARLHREREEMAAAHMKGLRRIVEALGPGDPMARIEELKASVDRLQREVIDLRNAELLTQKRWNHCMTCGAPKGADTVCERCATAAGGVHDPSRLTRGILR